MPPSMCSSLPETFFVSNFPFSYSMMPFYWMQNRLYVSCLSSMCGLVCSTDGSNLTETKVYKFWLLLVKWRMQMQFQFPFCRHIFVDDGDGKLYFWFIKHAYFVGSCEINYSNLARLTRLVYCGLTWMCTVLPFFLLIIYFGSWCMDSLSQHSMQY